MKNNRGFSVFELLIGFVFLIIISYFLFTTMFDIRDRRQLANIESKLVDLKNAVTQEIEYDLFNDKFVNKIDCGTGCYDFNYASGLTKRFIIDTTNNSIKYGDSTYNLVTDSYFVIPYKVDTVILNDTYTNRNNAILVIKVPIEHVDVEGDFGINIAHPYNTNTPITPVALNK